MYNYGIVDAITLTHVPVFEFYTKGKYRPEARMVASFDNKHTLMKNIEEVLLNNNDINQTQQQ